MNGMADQLSRPGGRWELRKANAAEAPRPAELLWGMRGRMRQAEDLTWLTRDSLFGGPLCSGDE